MKGYTFLYVGYASRSDVCVMQVVNTRKGVSVKLETPYRVTSDARK